MNLREGTTSNQKGSLDICLCGLFDILEYAPWYIVWSLLYAASFGLCCMQHRKLFVLLYIALAICGVQSGGLLRRLTAMMEQCNFTL